MMSGTVPCGAAGRRHSCDVSPLCDAGVLDAPVGRLAAWRTRALVVSAMRGSGGRRGANQAGITPSVLPEK